MSNFQHSTSLWLVVNALILTVASFYILQFTPLGFDIANQSDRIDVLDKIDQFPKQNPGTILMLGSSLGIFPAALSDFKNFGEPKPGADKFLNYCSYRYLDRLLGESNKQEYKTLNLSYQGGMTSEDLLILKGSLKAGIKPKLVILLTGPRDFLDHQTNKIDQSKLSKALLVRISNSIWDYSKSATANLEIIASRFLPLYVEREAITKLLTTKLKQGIAQVTQLPYHDKPAPTGGSLESIKDEPGTAEMMDFYTANYKIRYLPIDWQRWKLEAESLNAIISLCQQEQLPLLVVAMPLSHFNRNLLPIDFISKHQNMLKMATSNTPSNKSKTLLLDLFADENFDIADFMDTVHLRSSGGMKLAKRIADAVDHENLLNRRM